jgi:hypothetical protein
MHAFFAVLNNPYRLGELVSYGLWHAVDERSDILAHAIKLADELVANQSAK